MKDFTQVPSSQLSFMSQSMLQDVVVDDGLQVESEVEVCEMLLKWIELQKKQGKSFQAYPILTSIRWSDVPAEYVKSRLQSNPTLNQDDESFEFLSKVLYYRHTRVQSQGICTFHRPSTGQEQSVVILGVNTGEKVIPDVYRLSLSRKNCVTKLPDMPTQKVRESAACVVNDVLYVTGIGGGSKQTWMWTVISAWVRCGDLVQGRRRHRTAVVANSDIYVLGGFVKSSETCLSSIEQYKRTTNRWKKVGELAFAAECSACAVHKTYIYVFGGCGSDTNTDLDTIQLFDTLTKGCSVLKQRLPRPERLLRAVRWEGSVILINNRSCLIFDVEKHTCEERHQFAPGLAHFGLVLANQNIFIIGGGISTTDKDDKSTGWTYSGEVNYVPVMDIIDDQSTANWTHHAKLPTKCTIQAFSDLTSPL
jgi:hypothetical protein